MTAISNLKVRQTKMMMKTRRNGTMVVEAVQERSVEMKDEDLEDLIKEDVAFQTIRTNLEDGTVPISVKKLVQEVVLEVVVASNTKPMAVNSLNSLTPTYPC